jgi:hypothetical protein
VNLSAPHRRGKKRVYRQFGITTDAEYYYKKALETSQNAELKAHAAFMLAEIDQTRYFQQPNAKSIYVGEFGKQYYVQFQQTKFFRDHPCPMIENFMQKK